MVVLAFVAVAVSGCDKVPLVAPSDTTITLFSNTQVLPLNGTAEVTASVIQSGGNPVHNGTVVSFTTSLGRIEPAEATTTNGKVTVKLIVGSQSGTAEVSAYSGSNSAGTKLSIAVGAAAAASVVVSASPSTVSSAGSSADIMASVLDASGNLLPGVPVSFSTTAGSLTQSNAVTDANGRATTSLWSSATATVTATAGSKSGTVTVTATQAPAVTMTGPSGTILAGQPVVYTVTPSGSVADVTLDFGDGSRTQRLGPITSATQVAHTFDSPGAYTVTAVATDGSARSASATVVTIVQNVAVSLAISPQNPAINAIVTYTASVSPTTIPVLYYQWDFGDNTTTTTTSPTTSHTYNRVGVKTVTVTAVTVTGAQASTQLMISVQ